MDDINKIIEENNKTIEQLKELNRVLIEKDINSEVFKNFRRTYILGLKRDLLSLCARRPKRYKDLKNKMYMEAKTKQEEFDKHYNYTNYEDVDVRYINFI